MVRSRIEGGYVANTYLDEVGVNPVLTPKEAIGLAQRIERGDSQAKERLIQCNLRLVVCIANGYGRKCPWLVADLIEEGNLGLIKAVERFEWRRGTKFSDYAQYWIVKFILRAMKKEFKACTAQSLAEDDECRLGYFAEATEPSFFQTEAINCALAELDFSERQVVCMKFGLQGCTSCTSKEVSEEMGISFSAVNRINKGALEKMRRNKEMLALR